MYLKTKTIGCLQVASSTTGADLTQSWKPVASSCCTISSNTRWWGFKNNSLPRDVVTTFESSGATDAHCPWGHLRILCSAAPSNTRVTRSRFIVNHERISWLIPLQPCRAFKKQIRHSQLKKKKQKQPLLDFGQTAFVRIWSMCPCTTWWYCG